MKFKEFRMLCINMTFFVLMIAGMVYFFLEKQFSRAIIGSVLVVIMATMILGKYTLKVFNDSLLGYQFKGIGIMPVLIEFNDIKDIRVVSKHRVCIEHKEKSIMYLVDAKAFCQEVEQKIKEYKKTDE